MFLRTYFVPTVCSEAICQPCRISINQDDIALLLLLLLLTLHRFNSQRVLLSSILLSPHPQSLPNFNWENITFQHQWLKLWFGSNEQKAESCNSSNLNFWSRRVETNLRDILSSSIYQHPIKPAFLLLITINWGLFAFSTKSICNKLHPIIAKY